MYFWRILGRRAKYVPDGRSKYSSQPGSRFV
jgi:hypothetical protein